MNMSYEKLPLIDLTVPKVLGRCNRRENSTLNETIAQNSEDAVKILKLAGVDVNKCTGNIIKPREMYMVETQPNDSVTHRSKGGSIGMMQKGTRKPHYTRLLTFENRFVFQAAFCLPLKIIAASFDGNAVTGRVLFCRHSKKDGGKLAYEFQGKGTEMIIDLGRGEGTRAQRLIFKE